MHIVGGQAFAAYSPVAAFDLLDQAPAYAAHFFAFTDTIASVSLAMICCVCCLLNRAFLHVAVPKAMGSAGEPNTTTPEHLFAAGYATSMDFEPRRAA
ncbi:MAG: hypothetical protein WBX25_03675 [Rhodomicrobium sp.]